MCGDLCFTWVTDPEGIEGALKPEFAPGTTAVTMLADGYVCDEHGLNR